MRARRPAGLARDLGAPTGLTRPIGLRARASRRKVRRMIRHDYELLVNKSPATAFALLADVGRTPAWLSRCVEISRQSGGPLQVGEPLTYRYKEGSRIGTMEGAPAVVEPERKLVFAYADEMTRVRVAFELEPAGGGTKIHHWIEIDPLNFLMKLLQPLIRGAVKKQTAKDMATLKQVVEAEPGA